MYYVLGEGGAKYGPADLPTLKQWAAESRILPNMVLEDASTGAHIVAGTVPDLFGPAAPAAPASMGVPQQSPSPGPHQAPGMGNPGTQSPSSPYQSPTGMTGSPGPYGTPAGGPGTGPYSGGPSSPRPYSQNPYVGPTQSGQDVTTFVILGWIMAVSSAFCCLCLGPVGVFMGWKADKEGHPQGKPIMIASVVGMVISLAIGIMKAAPFINEIMRQSGR